MNQMQSYPDVHQSHMSATTAHVPSTGAPSALSHYPQYQQPPLLQPGPGSYPSQSAYGAYGYGNGVGQPAPGHPVSSSMNSALVPQTLPLPGMSMQATGPSAPQNYGGHTFDTTGQIAPPGMKPRVTATLWEDEGSLCFQVEAKGVCVARREDNHMINGTKLLNVAGMTRGRRDGILKSEKTRHVVKIGPMHLKGVWIPFERALDFANKEKITEQLYPLFVHDIGALLYHPSNQSRATAGPGALAAVDRRRTDPMQTQRYLGTPQVPVQTSQPPALHHHHSISTPTSQMGPQPPHSIAPHPGAPRPGIDRAHTFPTPPTSASSIMGMSGQGNSYEWSSSAVSGMQGSQPLSIDTSLSNRSVPTTPATTPPGNLQGMQQYSTSQGYDSSRQMYSQPPSQPGQYSSQTAAMPRYGSTVQTGVYPKSEMAPPSATGVEQDHSADAKPADSLIGQPDHGRVLGEVEEHEPENEYTHTNAAYGSSRGSYSYNPTGAVQSEHLSPEMTGSPHQNGSGRATPRTAGTGQPQWNAGYSTPQRAPQPPSTNLMHVMSNDPRASANGNAAQDAYVPPVAGYPSQTYAATNGASTNKRVRDVDEDDYDRPGSRDTDEMGLKRRKTIAEGTVGGAVGGSPYSQTGAPRPALSQRRR